MSTEQHIGPSSIVTKAGVGVDGPGYLAGEHPAGRTTVNGTPVSADVDVFYELDNKDWQCVASTTSQPDGTWSIVGLNPDKKFNVVARHASFGGVIVVDVQPSRTDVVTLSGAFTTNDDFNGVDGFMTIESGMPPFAASVVDPLPYGLTPLVVDGRKLLIDGASTDDGLWDSVVRITASNGVWVDVPVQVQIQALTDPHWDKVVSLLHFDGADGSTEFTDQTGRVWSRWNAVISTAQSLYGGASGYFNGSSNIVSDDAAGAFGTGDFLIEISVYFTQLATNIIVETRTDSDNAPKPVIYNVGATLYYYVYGANRITATGALATNSWKHIAVSRESGVTRLFVDGAQVGSSWSDSTNYTNNRIILGSNRLNTGNYVIGYMDEFRITKGVARYTANFTPPDKPFPNQ